MRSVCTEVRPVLSNLLFLLIMRNGADRSEWGCSIVAGNTACRGTCLRLRPSTRLYKEKWARHEQSYGQNEQWRRRDRTDTVCYHGSIYYRSGKRATRAAETRKTRAIMSRGTSPRRTLATLLRRHRQTAGLTQEELAERAQVSRRSIGALEGGAPHTPRQDTITLLADALTLSGAARTLFVEAARQLDEPVPSFSTAVSSAPPFVGRAYECALLERYLAGEGPPLLLVAGEPGIGKTRLLRAALSRAAAHGLCVLEGGCQRQGGQDPYAPLLGALQRHIRARQPVQLRTELHGCAWLVRLLPELATGPVPPLPPWTLTPAQERRLTGEAVVRFLTNVAGPAGTLLLLDDLQWAGPDALDLLATLVRSAGEVPLRIIGAYRTTEIQPCDALSDILADLAQAGLAARRVLGPLAPEEAGQLLDGLLVSREDEDSALRAQALRRAGGVPFFLVSCAHLLRHDGTEEGTDDAVPWDISQSIRQRAAALPEVARDLVGVAAVVGRVVPRALLIGAAAWPEDDVVAACAALCRARLLEEQGEDAYQFVHDVIREVIEGDLGTARRALLHRRIAQTLEQQEGDKPVDALAYHYARAGEHAVAALWLEQAGDRAATSGALGAALEYYGAARKHLFTRGTDSAGIARLDEKLISVRQRRGEYRHVLEDLERARTEAHEPARRAHLACTAATLWERLGEYERAVTLFAAAKAEGHTEPPGPPLPPAVQAAIALRLAHAHVCHSALDAAEAAREEAVTLLRQEAPSPTVDELTAGALVTQGHIARARGQLEQAEQAYRASLPLWERATPPHQAAHRRPEPHLPGEGSPKPDRTPALPSGGSASAWHALAQVALQQGALTRAREREQRSRATFEQVGSHIGTAWSDMLMGDLAAAQGDLPQAETWYRRSLLAMEDTGLKRGISDALCGLGVVACERGDLVLATHLCRRARRLAHTIQYPATEASAALAQARTWLRRGRPQQAHLLLAHGQSVVRTHGLAAQRIEASLLVVELRLAQGAVAESHTAAQAGVQLADRAGQLREGAVARRLVGQALLASGAHREAEHCLRMALGLQIELGSALEAARTRVLLAQVLLIGAESDQLMDEARTHMDLAHDQFVASEARLDVARAEQMAMAWPPR